MATILSDLSLYLGVFAVIFVLGALATRGVISLATRNGWVVEPNERSSHWGTLLIGGGGPIVVLTLATWCLLARPSSPVELAILAGAILLAVMSWIDDLKFLGPGTRLIFQIATVSLCLSFLPAEQRVVPMDLPLLADRAVTAFCWVWFINLFNFMDGIDGLAAVEAIAVSIGTILVGLLIGMSPGLLMLAAALCGAVAGFLPWNWHKSRIMLGDLGSIPIGFLLGFLLINLAIEGYLAVAIILPLYFLADASITLARRLIRGEKFWHPHRQHFYQRVVQNGIPHDQVVLMVTVANLVLIGSAVLSIAMPGVAALLAVATVSLLIFSLALRARG